MEDIIVIENAEETTRALDVNCCNGVCVMEY